MTAQEAFREILSLFYQRLARDPQARAAMRRVERQTATFTDTAQLSERASALLGEVFGEHVLDVPEELREAVCTALLRERYDTMNGILADVQEAADEALGLTLDAAHAPFPAERVQTVAHSLIDPGVKAATIQRRANKPVANVARSFHDDFIETNAKKRSDLGLRCHITRETDGKCCSWCDGLAGRYVYGRHPDDIFRRHDNCGCTVTYEEGRQRQDVWTKRSWERVDPEEVAAAAPEPTVFTQKDAAAMEERLLSGLTLAGERDIIEINKAAKRDEIKWLPKGEDLTPEARKRLTEHAKKCSIVLTGLRRSDVDEALVREIIDNAASMLKVYPELNADPARPFTIKIVNGLEANVFAQTTRRTSQNVVQLNANAFRDGAKLSEEYGKLAADKWFVKGTDHSAIVKHEIGHMYQAIHKISDDTIVETAMRVSRQTDRKSLFRFLTENLSEYAGSYKDGSEIISEVFADYYGSKEPTEFSIAFMDALNEMR